MAVSWANATILKIACGYNVSRNNDDILIKNIVRSLVEFDAASKPGTWLVDAIPSREQNSSRLA